MLIHILKKIVDKNQRNWHLKLFDALWASRMTPKDNTSVNSNLVQYLLQTVIQKRTEKIQWQIQTLHRDFSPGNPNREN